MSEEERPSFEEAYRELEATVHRLEEGSMALDESLALYERGMRLARQCSAALDAAELKVQQLSLGGSATGASTG
jgi:exodeoxyribonuclease VII small subunit